MTTEQLYDFYRKHPAYTTDSRDCPAGSIFFALKGETFDGNRFAAAALEKGCALAVVDDRDVYQQFLAAHPGDTRMALVDDVLQAFKDMAREHRRQFDIPMLAITGTNGKTTTKELVRAVLAEKYNVMATEGNFNNDVGVPKTLLRLDKSHEIAVVEMGASHPGDIATLARTAEPTCGLITNVGKAHLLGFGSFEGVIHTKGELYDALAAREDSLIFVNDDNEYLTAIVPSGTSTLRYTRHTENAVARVTGQIVDCSPFLRLRWRDNEVPHSPWHEVSTSLIGDYNLDNVLAAVTVGLRFGVEPKQIVNAIENYHPTNNRSQLVVTPHNNLIVDAYNANPTSMRAALDNFRTMNVTPKMVILGEMRELGSGSRDEHQRLVEQVAQCGFDAVWLVGREFAPIDCPYRKFDDVEQVREALAAGDRPTGYHILIKGSNGTRLFLLPDEL